MSAPHPVSSRPCPTGRIAYRDAWVGYRKWQEPEPAVVFELCPVCVNWHSDAEDARRLAEADA